MTPVIALTPFDVFEAELTGGGIVTRVLEAWSGGPVRAEVLSRDTIPASTETRTRLGVRDADKVGHRRVRLLCGARVLSEADNWFVPGRLTLDMRSALERTDTPFGLAIAPLVPRRRTLACERLDGDTVLKLHAVVLSVTGEALAEVVERYFVESLSPDYNVPAKSSLRA